MSPEPTGLRRRSGFTLIEILAVVAILALVAAFVAPNLGGLRAIALRGEAERLSARLELARQRAIVTGVPHRVWFDLDEAEFRVEWLAAEEETTPVPDAPPDLRGNAPLDLRAPRQSTERFQPVPGNFGRLEVVTEPFYVESLQTPEGPITRGEAWVLFDRDGGATPTEIVLVGRTDEFLVLEVYPLDDRVRIHDES